MSFACWCIAVLLAWTVGRMHDSVPTLHTSVTWGLVVGYTMRTSTTGSLPRLRAIIIAEIESCDGFLGKAP